MKWLPRSLTDDPGVVLYSLSSSGLMETFLGRSVVQVPQCRGCRTRNVINDDDEEEEEEEDGVDAGGYLSLAFSRTGMYVNVCMCVCMYVCMVCVYVCMCVCVYT